MTGSSIRASGVCLGVFFGEGLMRGRSGRARFGQWSMSRCSEGDKRKRKKKRGLGGGVRGRVSRLVGQDQAAVAAATLLMILVP